MLRHTMHIHMHGLAMLTWNLQSSWLSLLNVCTTTPISQGFMSQRRGLIWDGVHMVIEGRQARPPQNFTIFREKVWGICSSLGIASALLWVVRLGSTTTITHSKHKDPRIIVFLLTLFFIVWVYSICMYEYMCGCPHTCVCTWVEARGWHQVLILVLSTLFAEQGLSMGPELPVV